jgi:diguanylate cyclase (GGDEF)-like protein
MWKLINNWRYYSYGRERYLECMSKIFIRNLDSLRQVNTIAAVLAGCYAIVPMVVDKDFIKAGIYLATAIIALALSFFTNYKMQGALVSNRLIYILTTIYYTNIMLFGLYLGVWANPGQFAVTFMCIMICALALLVNPPLFNLFLTLIAMGIYIVTAVIFKEPYLWLPDICNLVFAGFISLFLNWQITKLRLGLELSANMLEDERNQYFDQSTVDELTKLKNRRDFMQTFQRYMSNYRNTDDWLCIAIADIDYFKNFNDHYGHPKGDDCLRAVGKAFNSLKDNLGVYAARVGGEEFALLWFEENATSVDTVVAEIMKLMGEMKMPHEKSKVNPYVSLSIGIYVERCGSPNDMQTLYDLADKALYAAKTSGRNRAVITGAELKQYEITPEAAAKKA